MTTPLKVFSPARVNVPVPIVVKPVVPEPSSITPEKVLDWVVSTVNVTGPATPEVTIPRPDRPLAVALWSARSSVPLTLTAPAFGPAGRASSQPSSSVAHPWIVVFPV
ncbi:MAG: hypothetical protein M5R36_27135 [Deltaproteobacteria bacterium]|nr:hypothetical protein [Deltaproteobacteria bacterium]